MSHGKDRIHLKGMRFFGYHGVLPEETRLGQKFIVDCTLFLSTRQAGLTDDLNLSVSYAEVYQQIQGIVTGKPYKLIEALAEAIAMDVLRVHRIIDCVEVTVQKPEAPVPGTFDWMGVTIQRKRNDLLVIEESWHTAYLGLGGNEGDVMLTLKNAVEAIKADPCIKQVKVSSVYKTEPISDVPQSDFYNLCIGLQTTYSPEGLLEFCQRLEQEAMRVRTVHWGPRTLDVDVLLYDEEKRDTQSLVIPHPRMLERGFVLIPLLEIAPRLKVDGISLEAYLKNVADQGVAFYCPPLSYEVLS